MTKERTHIAITGAGLVGSLLALYLKKRGYRITVFERRPDPRKELVDGGRSINLALSARGLKALDEHGLADTIRRIAIPMQDRKSTRLNSSHVKISYAVFCLKKKKNQYVI